MSAPGTGDSHENSDESTGTAASTSTGVLCAGPSILTAMTPVDAMPKTRKDGGGLVENAPRAFNEPSMVQKRIRDTAATFLRLLRNLTEEERVEAMSIVSVHFCRFCWSIDGNSCYCRADD